MSPGIVPVVFTKVGARCKRSERDLGELSRPRGSVPRHGRSACANRSKSRIRLPGVVSLNGFGEETDAGTGQESGRRGREIEVSLGWTSRSVLKASISCRDG